MANGPTILSRITAELSARPFFKNVMSVSAGTVAGLGIGVLALPLLSRLYTPEGFGIYASFLSVMAPLLAISSLRYDLAIPVPRADRDALALVAVSVLTTCMLATSVAFVVGIGGNSLWASLGVSAVAPWAWALPIGILFGGAYQIANFWATRKGLFGPIGRTKAAQAIATVIVQLAGSLFSGGGGLILGEITGRGAGSGTLLRASWQRLRAIVRLSWNELTFNARKYVAYPKYMAASAGLAVATVHALPLAYAMVYDVGVAGQIGLASKVLLVPAMLVGRSVSQVFLQSAAQAAQVSKYQLWSLYNKILRRLIFTGLAPFVFVAGAAPYIFPLLFGEAWGDAGYFASALAVASFFQFVVSPLTHGLIVVGKQASHLLWDLGRFVSIVAVFVISHRYGVSPLVATMGVAGVISSSYMIHVGITYSALR